MTFRDPDSSVWEAVRRSPRTHKQEDVATQTETTQRQELDQAWVEEFLKRWEAAWNSHEPERLLELMTEDIVYDDS